MPDDADTYKCFATNKHGRAVCTVLLNVIEGRTSIYFYESNHVSKLARTRLDHITSLDS